MLRLSTALLACLASVSILGAPARALDLKGWESRAALETWMGRSSLSIMRAIKVPDAARRLETSRQAVVRFEIDRSGRIGATSLAKSTGVPALDKAALDAVKATGRLSTPPLAEGVTGATVTAPIRFRSGERTRKFVRRR